MLRKNLLTIKSLIVASSWSHIYLLIKDARSLEHKVPSRFLLKPYAMLYRHFIFFHFITTTDSSGHYGLAIYKGPSHE